MESGRLVKLSVRDNQFVRTGDVLMVIGVPPTSRTKPVF
jgi:multidrug resistance efflux pump